MVVQHEWTDGILFTDYNYIDSKRHTTVKHQIFYFYFFFGGGVICIIPLSQCLKVFPQNLPIRSYPIPYPLSRGAYGLSHLAA